MAESVAKQHTPQPIEQQQCPLCLICPGKSQRNFVGHVGRHLEGIALAVLPREDSSGSDSESNESVQGEQIERKESISLSSEGPKLHPLDGASLERQFERPAEEMVPEQLPSLSEMIGQLPNLGSRT